MTLVNAFGTSNFGENNDMMNNDQQYVEMYKKITELSNYLSNVSNNTLLIEELNSDVKKLKIEMNALKNVFIVSSEEMRKKINNNENKIKDLNNIMDKNYEIVKNNAHQMNITSENINNLINKVNALHDIQRE